MAKRKKTLTEMLRDAINEDGRTVYQIAKVSNVTQAMIWRFLDGKDIRLSTAERLCENVGIYHKYRQRESQ